METALHAVGDLSKKADVMLIQEHWYFDCQLNKLEEVCELLTGTGKAVDTGDPRMPTQMPRGYSGVAVLWKKEYRPPRDTYPRWGEQNPRGRDRWGQTHTSTFSIHAM